MHDGPGESDPDRSQANISASFGWFLTSDNGSFPILREHAAIRFDLAAITTAALAADVLDNLGCLSDGLWSADNNQHHQGGGREGLVSEAEPSALERKGLPLLIETCCSN